MSAWSKEVIGFAEWVEKHDTLSHEVKLDIMDHLQRVITMHYDDMHSAMMQAFEAAANTVAALGTPATPETVKTDKTS